MTPAKGDGGRQASAKRTLQLVVEQVVDARTLSLLSQSEILSPKSNVEIARDSVNSIFSGNVSVSQAYTVDNIRSARQKR